VSHDRALLRALATRIWVLHDERITDFPGTFAEWEQASAERAHAARVAAAEQAKVREVHERQKVRRNEESKKNEQAAKRDERKAIESAEARIAQSERRVNELKAELENPDLYAKPDGVKRSVELGKQLEVAKGELDRAFEQWGRLTDGGKGNRD